MAIISLIGMAMTLCSLVEKLVGFIDRKVNR